MKVALVGRTNDSVFEPKRQGSGYILMQIFRIAIPDPAPAVDMLLGIAILVHPPLISISPCLHLSSGQKSSSMVVGYPGS